MKQIICNKRDSTYALTWSKRIRATNLLGGKCEKCGNDNIFVLDFHHKDGQKEYTFNKMKDFRWSKIEAEVKKCILLCKNCHQQYHYPETNLYKNKLLEAKGVSGCLRCGYNDCLTSLDFHHRNKNEKAFTIGFVCRKHGFMVSLENMIREIEKCDVICRNCHSIDQVDLDKFNRLKTIIYDKIEDYKEPPACVNEKNVIDLFNGGMRSCNIARKMNCASSTISLILRRNGIKINRKAETFEKICPVCEKTFKIVGKYYGLKRVFCSMKCKGVYERKIEWPTKEQLKLDIEYLSWMKIGEKYNVTDNAVRYWAKRYGLLGGLVLVVTLESCKLES